jgi:uracil-DNA glycosylase family 4
MDAPSPHALVQRLESLARAGVTNLPKPSRAPAAAPARGIAAGTIPADLSDRVEALAILRDEVAACTRCEELAAGRTQTVFGVGPANARLCFLGEAPGADEDASGVPFVGRAGELLTKIIEACTLSRDEVFILNVLKCRPPDNRPPRPDEVANCRGFFERQLAIIQPEFICCLGTSAAQSLLQTTDPIGKLRHRWFDYRTARVMCTYHPSYLLRNPAAKRDVWDDMKVLMEAMGVTL